jgi:hypothetical protein
LGLGPSLRPAASAFGSSPSRGKGGGRRALGALVPRPESRLRFGLWPQLSGQVPREEKAGGGVGFLPSCLGGIRIFTSAFGLSFRFDSSRRELRLDRARTTKDVDLRPPCADNDRGRKWLEIVVGGAGVDQACCVASSPR